jgi:hypothetical protein
MTSCLGRADCPRPHSPFTIHHSPKTNPRPFHLPYSLPTGPPKRDHDEWLAGRDRWTGIVPVRVDADTVISTAKGSTGRATTATVAKCQEPPAVAQPRQAGSGLGQGRTV